RIYRKSKIGEDVLRGGLPGNVGRILEEPWHGPEAVVVFGRKEEIVTKAGLRGEGKRRGNSVIRVQFDNVVLCAIGGIEARLNHAQIVRLALTGIGIQSIPEPFSLQSDDVRQRVAQRCVERIR